MRLVKRRQDAYGKQLEHGDEIVYHNGMCLTRGIIMSIVETKKNVFIYANGINLRGGIETHETKIKDGRSCIKIND